MAVTICDKLFRVFLLIFNAVLFVGTLAVNGYGMMSGLFDDKRNDTIHYDLDIIPAPWTFAVMWSTIYLFQAAMILYSLVNICRPNPGGYLYYFPDILPIPFLLAYMGNWLCNSSWILVAIRAMTSVAFLPIMTIWLWLLFATLAVSLVFSYRALDAQRNALTKFGLSKDIYVVIVLVQNGASIYATWSAIAASINGGLLLSYYSDCEKEIAGMVVLVSVSTLMVIYVSFDTFVLDRYTRYVFAPHCTLVLALSGSLARLGVKLQVNSIFVLIFLIIGSILLVVKIAVTIKRARKDHREIRMKPLNEDYLPSEKLPLP